MMDMQPVTDLRRYLESGNAVRYLFFWSDKSDNSYIDKSCLSQWYNSPFRVNGVIYNTAEHFMMAKKAELFGDTAALKLIINCQHPGEAKKVGREISCFDESVWNDNKFNIVVDGSFHKFNSNPDIREYLISTGRKILVEASPIDKVWGDWNVRTGWRDL